MASSLPSSSTQTRTSAPRSPAAAATVRSTISVGSLYTGTKTSTATRRLGGRGSRTRSLAHVHQNPNAWIRLKTSAAISRPYRYGVPIRSGLRSHPKYQTASGSPIRAMMRTLLRTLIVVGTGCQVTRRRRTSQGRLLIGTPIPWSAAFRIRAAGGAGSRASRPPCWSCRRTARCPGTMRARSPGCRRAPRGSLTQLAPAQLGRVVVEDEPHVLGLEQQQGPRPATSSISSMAPRKSYRRGCRR